MIDGSGISKIKGETSNIQNLKNARVVAEMVQKMAKNSLFVQIARVLAELDTNKTQYLEQQFVKANVKPVGAQEKLLKKNVQIATEKVTKKFKKLFKLKFQQELMMTKF